MKLASVLALAATAKALPQATTPPAANSPPSTSAVCTTTLLAPVRQFNMDRTCTEFKKYSTSTHYVNCGGCKLEMSSIFLGHGPVKPSCTTTKTVATSVETTTVCGTPLTVPTNGY